MRSLFLAVLFALIGFVSAPAFASSEAPTAVDLSQEPSVPEVLRPTTSASQRYAFTISASNARMQLRINDIPVMFKIFRQNETVDIAFNEWLKRGLNVVDLQVERFSENDPYQVKFSVYFQSPTQVVSGERRILFSSPEQVALPMRQPIGIRASSVPNMRIWQTEKIDFSPEEKDRLVDSLNSMRRRMMDALSKSDNAFLATYDKPIRDEIEKSYGRVPGGEQDTLNRRMEIADKLRKLVNARVEASPELKVDELSFEVIGEGRLVRITRLDGAPVIRVSRGDLVFTISKPIYGTVGGLWDIMRND